jgi:hypothetical protein
LFISITTPFFIRDSVLSIYKQSQIDILKSQLFLRDRPPDLQGCQIFLGTTNQKGTQKLQSALTYTKVAKRIPNGREITQNYPSQGLAKCTKIGVFVIRKYHLATLPSSEHFEAESLVGGSSTLSLNPDTFSSSLPTDK